MLFPTPTINPELARIAPGFRALSIMVEAAPIAHPQIAADLLADACRAVQQQDVSWAQAHLDAWQAVFIAFGAKPKRTPCSAEALRKRVLKDGALPAIDPVVDIYNAISIRYALPIGGENIAAYAGTPRLTFASGSEPFDTMKAGEPAEELPEAGEVVWLDEKGVTCRRWNWRQGVRTRLDSSAGQMWFILESLPAMPLCALEEAGEALINALQQLMPGAKAQTQLLTL